MAFSIIDIVERFQLSLMLIAVAFRNLIELSGSEFDFTDALILPQSFGWSRHGNIVWRIFSVCLIYATYRICWSLSLIATASYDSTSLGVNRRLA
jgi:Eukaryotic membrane protein family